MKRANLLVTASTVSMLGWGTVLPYQYAYAAQTRGWGSIVAAGAASLFSVGALVAAPFAGRLADRMSPARVAIAAKVLATVATGAMILATSAWTFLLAMTVFGIAVAAAVPAQSVLVLRWVDSVDRRKIFALQFTGQSVGMAIGAFAAGFVVDLQQVDGMNEAFGVAAGGFALSALLVALAARGDTAGGQAPSDGSGKASSDAGSDTYNDANSGGSWQAILLIVRTPTLRWTAIVTIALALGFYAQFESGLPAYAMTVLDIPARTVGTASAVNCLVIVALQMIMVRLTAKASGPSLLIVVGGIWVLSWGLLALAGQLSGLSGTMFVVAFGVFAVGETMYGPVLNPLTASLAPAGMVGTMLGLFAALQTGVSAVGPMVSGVILGGGHGGLFVAVHVVISVVAVLAAVRLWRLLRLAKPAPVVASEAARVVRQDGLGEAAKSAPPESATAESAITQSATAESATPQDERVHAA